MTDYCASSDIEANLKGVTFGASTKVTSTALGNIISQESAVIDQHISTRYDLPITDATALLFLKKICIDLVVYRVARILQPKSQTAIPADSGQDISHVTAYRESMKMLKNILSRDAVLPGETLKSLTLLSSTAVDCDETMTFEYGTVQW